MQLDQTWTEISTGTCVVQRKGTAGVLLKYSAITPTGTAESFTLSHNDPAVFPEITGLTLYAIAAGNGRSSITVQDGVA